MDQLLSPYALVVVGIFLALAAGTWLAIRRFLSRRKRYIDELERTNPVLTRTPFHDSSEQFKQQAKRGLKNRFTIINRVVFVSIGLGLLLLVFVPFMDELPQAVISVLVTSSAVIVGIAAKPLIENFLSGIVITTSKKLNIGDTVLVDGHYGTIEDITTTHTVVKVWDWRRFLIPNREMLDQKILSYSLFDSWHWVNVEFTVSPKADLKLVRQLAVSIAADNPYSEDVEPPSFWIREVDRNMVKCWVAAWASSPARSWELASEVRTELVIALQEHGIETHTYYHQLTSDAPLSNQHPAQGSRLVQ